MSSFEIVISILTAIYVLTTVVHVRISKSTLHAIRDQAKSSSDQFTEQLAEAKRASEAAMKGAGAAEQSALAAKASADALVNSERAWLLVDIEPQGGKTHLLTSTNSQGEDNSGVYVVIIIKNHGRSPAWITQQIHRFEIEEEISEAPDFSKELEGEKYSVPLAPGADVRHNRTLISRGHVGPKKKPVLFGMVRYTDVFGRDHSTTFGYHVSLFGKLDRMSDYPPYNIST